LAKEIRVHGDNNWPSVKYRLPLSHISNTPQHRRKPSSQTLVIKDIGRIGSHNIIEIKFECDIKQPAILIKCIQWRLKLIIMY
jgi:hypothetical protein